jgi:flagellar assembly protein FliH
MSSSAPTRQHATGPLPFAYPDARAEGAPMDGGPSLEERGRRQQAEIFEQGRQSAQQQLRAEFDIALAKSRERIGQALQQFTVERQSYYRRVEGEVVQLALAIARKILHREVQIDPQALAGVVRVTLEKLDSGTKVNLRVHPPEAADWRHYFACRMDDGPTSAPEVHEDAAIPAGECRIETSLGSTEIGLESQLKEIETGLLDLLAERPDAVSSVPSASTPNTSPAISSPPERGPETR